MTMEARECLKLSNFVIFLGELFLNGWANRSGFDLRKEDTLCCSVLLITFGNSGLCHFSASLSHIVNIVNVKYVENSKHQSMIMAVDVRGWCWSVIQCAHFTICILCLIRPHRSTTYVDVAYSYRPSSMVCRSVCHVSEPCKNSWTDRDAIWVVYSGGPKKACKYLISSVLDGAQILHAKGQSLGNGHARACPTTLCCELCKNGWTDQIAVWVVDSGRRRKHKFSRIRQVAPICPHGRTHWLCPHGRAHWHNVENTIEPSICSGDAALCQITLTTCYIVKFI